MVSNSVFRLAKSAGSFLLDAFDGVLGSEPDSTAARREAFISANLLAGAIGVAAWPLHWLLIGPVDTAMLGVFVFMWSPLFIGLAVKLGWELEMGQAASAWCLSGFVTCVALISGGVTSPALPWLLIVPIEAAVSRRSKDVLTTGALAGLGFFICASLSMMEWLPASRLPADLTNFASGGSIFAALIVGMLSLRAFQRRHEQDASRMSRRNGFLQSMTSGAPDLLTRHSASGTVLYASPSIEDMLGIRAAEFEGLSPAMFVHIQDLKSVELALHRTLSTGPQSVEFRLRRRDGTYVSVEMNTQTIEGDIVAVTRDVTARNSRIADLVIARDRADETGQARLRFLASITHELRTPLNAIIGFADMMHNEVFGPLGHTRYREYADHIRDSGLHLLDLVSDLLDMSKIESGKFSIERRRFDVKPLVDECLSMVSASALTAGVNLANEVKAGVFANADRRAIKQAMVNLLSNAIKFTPTEGTVTVSINPRADGVDLVVADTGVGIPAGDLERIGKPFEQVSGMKSLHRGTGLGLSLVKALIELHQGHMTIVSALGDGTTVTLSIPDGEAEADQIPEDPTLVYPARFKVRA